MFYRHMAAPSDSTKAPLEDLKSALEALSAKGFRAEVMGDRSVILVPKAEIDDLKPKPYDSCTSDTLLIMPGSGRHIHAHAGESWLGCHVNAYRSLIPIHFVPYSVATVAAVLSSSSQFFAAALRPEAFKEGLSR
jgi:hypothetical protein